MSLNINKTNTNTETLYIPALEENFFCRKCLHLLLVVMFLNLNSVTLLQVLNKYH